MSSAHAREEVACDLFALQLLSEIGILDFQQTPIQSATSLVNGIRHTRLRSLIDEEIECFYPGRVLRDGAAATAILQLRLDTILLALTERLSQAVPVFGKHPWQVEVLRKYDTLVELPTLSIVRRVRERPNDFVFEEKPQLGSEFYRRT